jgi:hypothetical protein
VRSRVIHAAQILLGLAVMLFVVRYVSRNWNEVRSAQLDWQVSAAPLLAALVVVWGVFVVQAESWRAMVAAWGYRVSRREGWTVWLLSSMAKYVPGKVWALAGMAVMSERRGIPAWASAGSAILLQVLSLGTGALVVALFGSSISKTASLGAAAVALVAVGLALWRPLLSAVLARVAPGADLRHIPRAPIILLGAAANLAAWIGYGVAFWLFARGVLPRSAPGVVESVGAYTASYVAGVIAPFAPGGLGVREGVLVMALRDHSGLGPAMALAAVARLGMTVAEVIATIPFLLRRRESLRA